MILAVGEGGAAGGMVAQALLVQHKSTGFWPHVMWLKGELNVVFPKAEQTQEPC